MGAERTAEFGEREERYRRSLISNAVCASVLVASCESTEDAAKGSLQLEKHVYNCTDQTCALAMAARGIELGHRRLEMRAVGLSESHLD